MKDIDVSVIITSYNIEGYISRAIESALGQKDVNVEVIVVDDASTDGTWDIISRYSGPYIKTRRLTDNGGPGVARNAAIAMATGKWIAVLDGDDAFEPGRLARLLRHPLCSQADIIVDNLK